jgi:hypothetical protein
MLLVLGAVYGLGRLAVVSYDSTLHLPRQPYLQKQTPNSMVIKWQTPQSEIGCVNYGQTNLEKRVCEIEATDTHVITLNQLEKGTSYFYAVSSESLDIDNESRYFTTLSDDVNLSQKMRCLKACKSMWAVKT